MDLLKYVESAHLRFDLPLFRTGQTLRVHSRILEGDKERIQVFEGTLIRHAGSGLSATITVRKISNGVGVERIYPIHSPRIARIEVMAQGKVRRSRLYYLRQRVGRQTRLRRVEEFGESE
jgi:large subunit ribosomal protein L19